jgi:hypothetical protein
MTPRGCSQSAVIGPVAARVPGRQRHLARTGAQARRWLANALWTTDETVAQLAREA